ncbi:MAG: ATP-binding protein, partial [Oscillospiraceae bacterium]|nr:ATP-binding protein [Oscillospiraceae bacterium]
LEPGTILFWDEPEASINPELLPTLVDILLELQRGGVQIFLATHSYDVARWLELNRQSDNALRYFNLRKEGDGIVADVADDYISLGGNPITAAGDKLLKKAVEVSAKKAGVRLK